MENRQSQKKLLAKIVAGIVGLVGFIAGVVAIIEFTENRPPVDLSGEWLMTNTIEETTGSYKGLVLGFRVFFSQEGNQIKGEGEKVSENDVEIPSEKRTPIELTGSLRGNTLKMTFVEQGLLRRTSGQITWQLSDSNRMEGEFSSTAASTRGSSTAARVK